MSFITNTQTETLQRIFKKQHDKLDTEEGESNEDEEESTTSSEKSEEDSESATSPEDEQVNKPPNYQL